jgi:hypothetical protein
VQPLLSLLLLLPLPLLLVVIVTMMVLMLVLGGVDVGDRHDVVVLFVSN